MGNRGVHVVSLRFSDRPKEARLLETLPIFADCQGWNLTSYLNLINMDLNYQLRWQDSDLLASWVRYPCAVPTTGKKGVRHPPKPLIHGCLVDPFVRLTPCGDYPVAPKLAQGGVSGAIIRKEIVGLSKPPCVSRHGAEIIKH